MATFYDTKSTNDPSYLNLSREPDKISPRNYTADKSMEALFTGIGEVVQGGAAAIDASIKTSIYDRASELIDPIRNEHGADLGPGEVPEIAGNGARGRSRAAAQGLFGEDTQPEALPQPIVKATGSLERMSAAHRAGKLSDSYYYSQLQQTVQQLRAEYPGYRQQIDSTVSSITGVTPANALRTSLLSDLNAAQAAVATNQNAIEKRLYDNREFIVQDYPDFYSNRNKYAGREQEILSDAFRRQGIDQKLKSEKLMIEGNAAKAEGVATSAAFNIVQRGVSGSANLINLPELQKRLHQLQSSPNRNPEDIQGFVDFATKMLTDASVAIDQEFARGMQEDPQGRSLSVLVANPNRLKEIKEQALAPIETMRRAVQEGNFSLAAGTANLIKNQTQLDARNAQKNSKAVRTVAALRELGGDAFVGIAMQDSATLPALQKSLADGSLIDTIATPVDKDPPKITDEIGDGSNGGTLPVAGKYTRVIMDQRVTVAQDKTAPKEARSNAMRSVFDEKFFAGARSSADREVIYRRLVNPQMTAAVAEVGDPRAIAEYQKFAVEAGRGIFQDAVSRAIDTIGSTRYAVVFDPDTFQFAAAGQKGDPYATDAAVQARIGPINGVLSQMRDVFALSGEDTQEKMLTFMASMGLNPNAKKDQGEGFLGTISKAFNDGVGRLYDLGNTATTPAKTREKGQRGVSLQDAPEAPLREIIGKAETSGDYNAVYGLGKNTTRDLSQFSVAEIMAMQKSYTDRGSESSAVGKYQFLRKTLNSLVRDGIVDPDEPFTPDVQDRLAIALMNRRGLENFRAGQMTEEKFINNLSKEWAGLPSASGMSWYDGDGLNKATIRLPEVLAALMPK